MIIIPAIDLYCGKVVRLQKGDYDKMTVYGDDPVKFASDFEKYGAETLHIVDLKGARDGDAYDFDIIRRIISATGLSVEVGGGIRTEQTVKKYIEAGAQRVILGTAAVTEPGFLALMGEKYGDKIAVGIDVKDGFVAIKGWREVSRKKCLEFCHECDFMGIKTVICTDVSKDGILSGTNIELYKTLSSELEMNIIASGGVSSLDDIKALCELDIYGAIVGRALYTGDINLSDAVIMTKNLL